MENLTFERQGLKRSELEIKNFKNIAKAAIDSKVGNILICKNRDNIVLGATLFLEDTKAAYYFAGANHPEYRKSGCGTFLLIESIRKCYDKNLKKIDMVGINSPNRGLFKVSLNALPTPYFEVDLSI
ncbi:MAG: GNAT family N-acetyltransferase [Bacteroidia bacterium]